MAGRFDFAGAGLDLEDGCIDRELDGFDVELGRFDIKLGRFNISDCGVLADAGSICSSAAHPALMPSAFTS